MPRFTLPIMLVQTVCALNIAGCGDKAVPYQPPPPSKVDAAAPTASTVVPSSLRLNVSGNEVKVDSDASQSLSIGKLPAGCISNDTYTQALTPELFSILVIAKCGDGSWWQTLWIVASKPALKIWQRFQFTERAPDSSVRLGARVVDQERFELVFTHSRGPLLSAEHSVAVPWQVQGRSLVRITEEPERSLRAAVDNARKAIKSSNEASQSQLDAVLFAHGLLCREVAGPKLVIQDSKQGLMCGRSRAAALAAALRFRQLAEAKDIDPALTLYQRLLSPALETSTDAEAALRAGWDALGSTTEFTLHQGPTVSEQLSTDHAQRVLEFLDEQTVLVRQSPPVRFTIGASEFEPVEVTASHGYVAHPKGKFVVVDVHRQCSAFALGLVPRALIAEPLLTAKPTRSVVFTDIGSDTRCGSQTSVKDDGGWRVVNWTDQGVLVVRAGEFRLVPIDAEGKSSGSPVILNDANAPSIAGYAYSVPGGVIVRLFGPNGHVLLMRPKAWAQTGDQPKHAILSPSTKRVAVVYQQRLVVLERTGT